MKIGNLKINFPILTTRQRKRKLLLLTSEDRLKDLPSIYTKIPADPHKKLNLLKQYLVTYSDEFHLKVIKNLK